MSTACHMRTKGKIHYSRISGFRLLGGQLMPTAMDLKGLTARVELVGCCTLLMYNV